MIVAFQLTMGGCDAGRNRDRPDLSGTYDIATLTPLERRDEFGELLSIDPDDPRVSRMSAVAGARGGLDSASDDLGSRPTLIDSRYRTSLITSTTDGKLPALITEMRPAIDARAANLRKSYSVAWWLDQAEGPYDGPESRPLAERCLLGLGSSAGPPALPVIHNNLKRIVQTEKHVLIHNEMVHDARIVRMNAEHLPQAVRRWMGDSVGWWEGDTLVVDTTNFRDETALFLSGRNLHVVERFSAMENGDLLYRFTVEDPAWVSPWGGEYVWSRTEQLMYEYACHEGNYSMAGTLKGARVLEAESESESGGS